MPYWMAPTYQQNQQTTAPCLLKLFASCWENVTSSKPVIAGNLSRDQNRMSSRLPASQSASAPSNSSIASSVPHAELAAVIASVVDERINRQLIQDGGTSNVGNAQLAGPSPPSNLQDSLRSSPPPQDGGQQQRPVNNNLPFKILQQVISQTPPFLLVSLLLLVLVPSHLLLTFLIQPKSHRFTRTSDSLPSPAI